MKRKDYTFLSSAGERNSWTPVSLVWAILCFLMSSWLIPEFSHLSFVRQIFYKWFSFPHMKHTFPFAFLFLLSFPKIDAPRPYSHLTSPFYTPNLSKIIQPDTMFFEGKLFFFFWSLRLYSEQGALITHRYKKLK